MDDVQVESTIVDKKEDTYLDNIDSESSGSDITKLQNELENLRHQLEIVSRESQQKDEIIKILKAKRFYGILRLGCRSLYGLKPSFDAWKLRTQEGKTIVQGNRTELQGRVNNHREILRDRMIDEAEMKNKSLTLTLLCTNYFFRWKLNSEKAALDIEREKMMTERQIIFREIRALRENVH